MFNLSWTPHSNLEDNSLKTTPVLAQIWAVWRILTKIARATGSRDLHRDLSILHLISGKTPPPFKPGIYKFIL